MLSRLIHTVTAVLVMIPLLSGCNQPKASFTPEVLSITAAPIASAATNTQAVEANPTQAAPAGQLVFTDDFSTDMENWKPSNQSGFQTSIADGALILTAANSIESAYITLTTTGQDLGDVVVEADVQLTSNPAGTYAGIVCRFRGEGNFTYMVIHDGSAQIGQYQDGEQVILVDDFPHLAIQSGTNHIKGECVGGDVSFSVNGEEIIFTSLTRIESGEVGIIAGVLPNSSAGEIRLDNFASIGLPPALSIKEFAPTPTPRAIPTADPSKSTALKIDPCVLLTKQDVEEVIQLSVGEAVRSSVGGYNQCAYETMDGNARQIGIQVLSPMTNDMFEYNVKESAKILEAEYQAIPGVGDNAYWFLSILQVLKEDVYFQYLPLYFFNDADALEILTELAQRAASRIGE